MNLSETPEVPRIGWTTRFLIKIAGADEAMLRLCPDRDWDNIRAISVLLIATMVYQTAVLSVVSHRILAPDEHIHVALVIGDAGITSLIALIDSYVFIRAGFYADGVAELARGGLDMVGGKSAKAKAVFFLAIRLFFAVAVAALMGIGAGLSLFAQDIHAEENRERQRQDAPLILEAKVKVDGQIYRLVNELKAQETQIASTEHQLASIRQGAVTSFGDDASLRSQQDEVNLLLGEKLRRDSDLTAAQTFSANELSGVRSDTTNSGVQGRGPERFAHPIFQSDDALGGLLGLWWDSQRHELDEFFPADDRCLEISNEHR